MAVARTSLDHGIRIGKLIIEADERLTVGVEALDRNVHTVEGVVIAALAVFGLVVDHRVLDFDLTGREIALEVLHVGRCIPQAPLGKGEQLEALHLIAVVGERELLHLGPCVQGHKEQHRCLDTVLAARDAGVVHAMTTLIAVERRLAGLPSRVPHGAAIVDVEVAAAVVHRHAVVAVARQAAELGILVEAVAAGRVGNQ